MYMDKELMFSEAQAVTATAASTNVVDLGSADSGNSAGLEIYLKVGTAFNNLTSLGIKLQTCATSDGTFTDTAVSETVLLASLTANSEHFKVKLPYDMSRYARLYYTVTGTAPTTGTITSGVIIDERQTN